MKAEIKELRGESPEDFARKLTLTKAGEVGKFPHQRCRVAEVIDKESALIRTKTRKVFDNPANFERDDDISVIVRDVDTSKWADVIAIDGPAGLWFVNTEKRDGKTMFTLTRFRLTKEESEAIMKAAKSPISIIPGRRPEG